MPCIPRFFGDPRKESFPREVDRLLGVPWSVSHPPEASRISPNFFLFNRQRAEPAEELSATVSIMPVDESAPFPVASRSRSITPGEDEQSGVSRGRAS